MSLYVCVLPPSPIRVLSQLVFLSFLVSFFSGWLGSKHHLTNFNWLLSVKLLMPSRSMNPRRGHRTGNTWSSLSGFTTQLKIDRWHLLEVLNRAELSAPVLPTDAENRSRAVHVEPLSCFRCLLLGVQVVSEAHITADFNAKMFG